MRITHLLTKNVIITRLTTTSGEKQAYATVTATEGHIQALSEERSRLVEGVFGKTFKIYVDADSDIQDGDRLRDDDNNYYTVKSGGVTRKTFGSFDFKQIVIIKNKK